MKNKLDLHGKKHNEVSNLIEDYILTTKTPFSIITGNSNTMKNITTNILDNYKFKWVIFSANLGEIIILE
jgi:hypothetical protein